jgi:hypothetical protein
MGRVKREALSQGQLDMPNESIRPADFSSAEIGALYGQHTPETGQVFEKDSVERPGTGPRDSPGRSTPLHMMS